MDFNDFFNALKKLEDKQSIKLKTLFNQYLTFKRVSVSPQTIQYYTKTIGKTVAYLESIGIDEVKHVSVNAFLQYISHLRYDNPKIKNNTLNKHIENFKYMFNYAVEYDIIETNPLRKLKKLPKDDVETEIVEYNYFNMVLDYLEKLPNTMYNLKCKTYMLILIDTGMRLNELKNLQVKNIELNNLTMKLVTTKTRKIRTVFFTKNTKKHLQNLIASENLSDYIYVSSQRDNLKILNHNYIYKFINKIKDDLNIPKSVSLTCHKWRHTLATNLLENGMNIEEVRKILGHSTITMTTRYLHVSTDKLQEDYNKYINRLKTKEKRVNPLPPKVKILL